MPAITLEDAYNEFDPRQPITRGQIETQFVERPFTQTAKLQALLTLTRKPTKLLFVGHRGSGKTSELTYLATRLDATHLTVPVPLLTIFRSPTISHTEVIFAILLRMLKVASDTEAVAPGLLQRAWDGLFDPVYQFLKLRLFGEGAMLPADKEASLTLRLNLLAGDIEARLGAESYTRDQVKERFAGLVGDLLDKISLITLLLEKDLRKKLLLVVEDLDKFDPLDTRALFKGHSGTLISPAPNIIYTFPVAMRYTNDFIEIRKNFDDFYQLPNLSLHHRNQTRDENGWRSARQILTRRADEKALFETGVVDELVRLSGGHVQTLLQLARQSVLHTVVAGLDRVQQTQVRQSADEVRNDYIALLKRDQSERLRQWLHDADKTLTDVTSETEDLLYNGSLLEYANTHGPWADINPIVAALLEQGLV
jgi:hypothetical protein